MPPVAQTPKVCALCEREVFALSDHHLVPKSRGGRRTEALCLDCHAMVHTLFDNVRLERELNTVATLRAEPALAKYLQWVSRRSGYRRYRPRRPARSRRRR